jgi:hypothetical protein
VNVVIRRAALAVALLGVAASFLFVPRPSGAQEPLSLSIDQVVAGDGSATVFLSALDGSGRTVPGITEFDVSIDGDGAKVESIDTAVDDRIGVSVLLAIDISGSMEGEPLERAQQAASAFVGRLLPHDAAAVYPFAGAVPEAPAFVSDGPQLVSQIEGFAVATTGTALYDGVLGSLAAATAAPTERRVVVFLSDGRDTASQTSSREDALEAASASGVPIYTVALGDADVAFLQEVAERSGGQLHQAPQAADLQRMFEEISDALRSQYIVAVRLPASENTERELLVGTEIEGRLYTARHVFHAPAAAAPAAGSGFPAGYLLLAGIPAVIGLGAIVYIVRRKRLKGSPPEPGPGSDVAPLPALETPTFLSRLRGRLTVVSGPNAGASVSLASGAVALGSDPSCDLRLDAANGSVAGLHARAWVQHDRLMLHHLARRVQTIVGDRPIDWATLDPDETLQIGPHTIAFALDPATSLPSRSA